MISIIVTLSKQHAAGIGYDVGKFPLSYFQRIDTLTRGGVVFMGRKTWDALPEAAAAMLTVNRTVVIVSTTTSFSPNVKFIKPNEIDHFITAYKDVFILGGQSLYAMFIDKADLIFASIEDQTPDDPDMVSPFTLSFKDFEIASYSSARHIIYQRKPLQQHPERAYLDVLADILKNGRSRDDRTKVGTLAVFGRQMRFDISKSVPLLTTKHMGWKSIVEELLWFLKGQTDSKILENKKINIWKGNTTREFLDNRGLGHYAEGDIGPMYGFQWRHMGAEYMGAAHDYKRPQHQGHDQLKWLIEQLKTDPNSRRHMITTYNPLDVDKGVLAPCHGIVVQFFVEADAKHEQQTLSCHVYNRSQDSFLGMPYNIFSYAVMVHIIAKFVGMTPHELVISTGDTHIYSNHVEQVREQLQRQPLPFPTIKINDAVLVRPNGIDDMTIDDFELIGYMSHPAIRAPMAV